MHGAGSSAGYQMSISQPGSFFQIVSLQKVQGKASFWQTEPPDADTEGVSIQQSTLFTGPRWAMETGRVRTQGDGRFGKEGTPTA